MTCTATFGSGALTGMQTAIGMRSVWIQQDLPQVARVFFAAVVGTSPTQGTAGLLLATGARQATGTTASGFELPWTFNPLYFVLLPFASERSEDV